ncbi:hypothetical protein BGZ99_002969, partial [Dissophora globulifera]
LHGLPNPSHNFENDEIVIEDKKPPLLPVSKTPEVELSKPFIQAKEQGLDYIQPALANNAAIPLNGFCPVPEMKVYLPVPPKTTVFRRQRPLPQADEQLLSDTVKRWHDEGIICLAPAGNPHNNPLTLAAKKDSKGIKSAKR